MFYLTAEKMEDVGTIDVIDELVSFAWNVEWSACETKKTGEFLQSPTFSTLSDDGKVLEWKLQLYPEGVNRKCRGSMSLYLRTLAERKRSFPQKVVYFYLLNNRNEEVNKLKGELYLQFKRDTCGLDQFIRRDLFERNAGDLLNCGLLTVICTMADVRTLPKFHSEEAIAAPPLPPRPQPLPRTKSLGDVTADEAPEASAPRPSDQFEDMLESGRSDVSIVVGGQTFCAHRAILAARSAYFRSNFEQDVARGKRMSFVDMSEFSAEDVLELMRYLYLEEVAKMEERASQLLAPANKYKLDRLKAQCEDVMIGQLSVANASEYLALSFLHEADKLQQKAMDFVVAQSLDVVSTPGFKAIAGAHANVIAAILRTIKARNS